MSMIDRYKKKGGFVQLLNVIETAGKEKQEKFLQLIASESPAWEAEVRKKLLTMDKVLSWNSVYIAEILPRLQPVQVALIYCAVPDSKKEHFNSVLGFKEKKAIEDTLKDKKPAPGEISSAIMKLFAEVRKMQSEGSLKFEKFDMEMFVDDDIEEKLVKGDAASKNAAPNNSDNNVVPLNTNKSSGGTLNYSFKSKVDTPSSMTDGIEKFIDELNNVRKNFLALQNEYQKLMQDNQRLTQENQNMRTKLEQIRKIA
jgi:hypothetical protein